MERRYPLINIGVGVATKLLQPLGLAAPCRLTLLAGGHINTNYVVTLEDGHRLVLRIFPQGEAALRKESHLLRTLAGLLPIPILRLAVFAPESFEYPYSVLEWIEGEPLNKVLAVHPEGRVQIGESVASTLHAIHRQKPPGYPSPPLAEIIRASLFEGGAATYLGPKTTGRLWNLVQHQSAFLQELCRGPLLVHGDFQGDNILLGKQDGRWGVAGVLDWEWAHDGYFLQDLGSLLRYEGEPCVAFQRGIESGFSQLGTDLPSGWVQAARIWDMAALCEKLAYPRHRGEVTFRTIRIIERCLQDYAG